MPHVGTPHVARVGVLWTSASDLQKCENVFYLEDTTDVIFSNPVGSANAVFAAVASALVPASDSGVIYNGISFEDVRTVPFGGIDVPETPTNGTHAYSGSALPSCTCKAIRKITVNLTRNGRGRWFFPLLNSGTLVTADTTSPAVIALLTGALTSFQTAVETALAPARMGIVSYFLNKVARSQGLFEPIIAFGANDVMIDTQRRRLLGHNRHR